MTELYDPADVLAGLKDFQRDTVDHVFSRLYTDDDATPRFLVADEVGLGKTLVARGVIARAVRHLQEKNVKRIDVIYVCSNSDIAEQNIRRLALPGFQSFTRATRLTMLPLELHDLTKSSLNFVAFTPGTSFNLRSSMGRVEERALLHVLLSQIWGERTMTTSGAYRVLQGGVAHLDSFKQAIHRIADRPIDQKILKNFRAAIGANDRWAKAQGKPGLRNRFDDISLRYRYKRRNSPAEDRHDRSSLIGDLRQLLASTCIDALEPDLVILDEFQRFRHLLDLDRSDAELAKGLFAFPDVRTLLLSATPYKMYSVSDETDDDHYRDFMRTASFLMGKDNADFVRDLDAFRTRLFHISDRDQTGAVAAKRAVERHLRKVMVRTERHASTANDAGMLAERASPKMSLEVDDLGGYLAFERMSHILGAGSAIEYWKSAPYLLNFMDGYKLTREFDRIDRRTKQWHQIRPILQSGTGLIDWSSVSRYSPIPAENARLRSLISATIDEGMWKLLWLPPSLSYYELGPPFSEVADSDITKRLVFSSWNVVPKVISALVSYEAERHMMGSDRGVRNTPEARKTIKPLLQVKRAKDDFSGLSILTLLYPSPTLASLGDPLYQPADGLLHHQVPSRNEVLNAITARVAEALEPITQAAPTDGKEDERWYWVAPMILDLREGHTKDWFEQAMAANAWSSRTEADEEGDEHDMSAFTEGLAYARDLALGLDSEIDVEIQRSLGKVPEDLHAVLAEVAMGAPGNAALRALTRAMPGNAAQENAEVRNAAARVAWAFRSLFNQPEVTTMIRALDGQGPFWQQALRYCINGGIQSVLDEYAHVLRDSLGILDTESYDDLSRVADHMGSAISLRAVVYRARDIDGEGTRDVDRGMRSRFATRFGSDRSDDEKELRRATGVRGAFNSPFWPFILATTSIGQEGLDFHWYCHAVVHWNLPSNPVDLEQREGRIHRYKGHAVRKNVARVHRHDALSAVDDPWTAAFEAAAAARPAADNDLVPYWMFPIEGGSTIDRFVPALPLSREVSRYQTLKRSLALYRLVFGQPRQEDLVDYLLSRGLDEETITALVNDLRIDISPPNRPSNSLHLEPTHRL